MRPHSDFAKQAGAFWAHIKLVSERLGYADRRKIGKLRRFTIQDVVRVLRDNKLKVDHLLENTQPTGYGERLVAYLNYRAEVLEADVAPQLMNRGQARQEFERLREELKPECHLPMNKQKGEKRGSDPHNLDTHLL